MENNLISVPMQDWKAECPAPCSTAGSHGSGISCLLKLAWDNDLLAGEMLPPSLQLRCDLGFHDPAMIFTQLHAH